MNRKLAIPLLFVSLGYAGSGLIAQELLDPFTRDEDISGTEVTVEVNEIAGGFYEYVYRVAAPISNKGKVQHFSIDLSCELDFGEVTFPVPPDPLFRAKDISSEVPYVPVQMYHDPVHTGWMIIGARGQVLWLISLKPGEAGDQYRLVSPAPPGLRPYRLVPSWASDAYDYDDLSQEEVDTVPWIHTFTVTGMIEAPACALPTDPPDPEPELFLGSGEESSNALLTYSEPLRDQMHVPSTKEDFTVTIFYGEAIDPQTFKVQPGWAKRFFNPVPGTRETVTIPLRESVNRIHFEVGMEKSKGPRNDDENHHSRKDRDTFEIRRVQP